MFNLICIILINIKHLSVILFVVIRLNNFYNFINGFVHKFLQKVMKYRKLMKFAVQTKTIF